MGRPRGQARAATTRQTLLAAAELQFARAGFEATRLEDIARAARITRPSLLHHFETKQALYEAVIHAAFARLGESLLVPAESPGPFPQQLDAVVEAYTGFLAAHGAFATLLVREVIDDRGPGHAILKEEVVPLLDWVERWIGVAGEGCVEPGVPVRAALMQVVADGLLRTVAGPLRLPFWGKGDHGRSLARRLLLKR